MFDERSFENFQKVLPKSGQSWLCIFIVMFVLIAAIALLGRIKTEGKENVDEETAKKTKTRSIALSVVAVIVFGALVGTWAFFAPVTAAQHCANGNYAEAYKATKTDAKAEITLENNVAFCTKDAAEQLKAAKSFKLVGAYNIANNGNELIALQITNDKKDALLLYTKGDNGWEYYSDVDNSVALIIEFAINDENKVDDSIIARINKLYADGKFDKLKFI